MGVGTKILNIGCTEAEVSTKQKFRWKVFFINTLYDWQAGRQMERQEKPLIGAREHTLPKKCVTESLTHSQTNISIIIYTLISSE